MTLPRYTILRNDVEVVFSPTDQLPDHLQGLPYRLELSRRDSEGWKSVGITHLPASMISFQVSAALHPDQSVPSVKTRFRAPDHSVRNDAVITAQASHSVRQKAPSSLKPPEPPGAERDPPKKEYCTYWIRHNSCDFMQEGCKYKHEMPGPKKLQELGFPEVPQWYKKKMAISNWLRPCSTEGRDNHQLSSQPSTSRSFRPMTVTQINSRPRVAGTPESTKIPARIPNLIDLENPSIGTKPRYPALAVDSITRPVRDDALTCSSQEAKSSSPVTAGFLTSSRHKSCALQDFVPSLPSPLHQARTDENKIRQDSRTIDDYVREPTTGSRVTVESSQDVDQDSSD